MIHPNFVILGAIIAFLGGLSYLVDTLKGKAKPNRVTWLLWSVVPFIAFSAEINKGVGIQSLMTFMVGFNPLLIFLSSFINKKSAWNLGKIDYIMGGLSITGIILWLVLKDGNFAIFFAILADGLAAVPTIVKSFHFPETENYIAFLTAAISAAITLLTIQIWDFAHYGFPIYILFIATILFLLIKFKLGKYITAKVA